MSAADTAADAATAELFAQHFEPLQRYMMRYTGDSDVAADIAQEAFVRLIEHGPVPAQAVPWLFRVATNLARDHARTRTRQKSLALPDRVQRAHSDPPAPPESSADRAGARRMLDVAFTALNERERLALLMREEGYSHREIAEAVETTTGSVGTFIARALRKAAARLREMEMAS